MKRLLNEKIDTWNRLEPVKLSIVHVPCWQWEWPARAAGRVARPSRRGPPSTRPLAGTCRRATRRTPPARRPPRGSIPSSYGGISPDLRETLITQTAFTFIGSWILIIAIKSVAIDQWVLLVITERWTKNKLIECNNVRITRTSVCTSDVPELQPHDRPSVPLEHLEREVHAELHTQKQVAALTTRASFCATVASGLALWFMTLWVIMSDWA